MMPVTFHSIFFVCRDTKQHKWQDLMGPEKLVFFGKVDLPAIMPQVPNIERIQALWQDFMHLHNTLQRKKFTPAEADCFGESAKKWVKDFTSLYQTSHVTPYIHVLAMHVSELKKHGNLVQFTQQGMEKLNDQTTIDYTHNTNHNYRNLEALKQLMEKRNRIEHLADNDFQWQTRTLCCSLCHQTGHNRLTCQVKDTVINGELTRI